MAETTLFVATPLRDSNVSYIYMAGALQAMSAFAGRIRFDVQVGGFICTARDILTAKFLDSPATHMLSVDADVGWTPADVQKLIDTGKDFVSGCYSKRNGSAEIPARMTGEQDGPLLECDYVPGGFLLVARPVIERMIGAYRDLAYQIQGRQAWALWANLFEKGDAYAGEDVAFCRRWRALGGQIWLHPGVVLPHLGEQTFLPDMTKAIVG